MYITGHKHSFNHSYSNHSNRIIRKDLADEKVRERGETQIETDQRMVNQKDPLQIVIEVMQSEMTKENKGASDVIKRVTLKEIA